MTKDGDTNGSGEGAPTDSWLYYALEGVWNLSDTLYTAARYSGAKVDELGSESVAGRIDRIQIGLGYWLTDFVLAKAEVVHQQYSDFETGAVVSGVDADRDPEFSGIITEVSFAF